MSEEFSEFLLAAAVELMTVFMGRPLPGSAMLGLDYKHSDACPEAGRREKTPAVVWRMRLIHFTMTIVLPGLHKFVLARALRSRRGEAMAQMERNAERLEAAERDGEPTEVTRKLRLQRLLLALLAGGDVLVEMLAKAVTLGHCLLFISNWDSSGSRSVADRVSGMRLQSVGVDESNRILSFDYLNQQLVWRELSNLFRVMLPAAATVARSCAGAAAALRADLSSGWGTETDTNDRSAIAHSGATARGGPLSSEKRVETDCSRDHTAETPLGNARWMMRTKVDDTVCGVCGCVGNHLPYVAVPCGHVFCYYCIAQHIVSGLPVSDGVAEREPSSTATTRTKTPPVIRCRTCFQRVTAIAPMRMQLNV